MLGETTERISAAMQANGVSSEQISAEIQAAQQSPYVRGGGLLAERIKKREWLLKSYKLLSEQFDQFDQIPTAHQLPADEFYANFYFRHRPVLLTGLIDHWPAMSRWSLDYFEQTIGDNEVEVQFGRDDDAAYEINNNKFRQRMVMRDFVNLLRQKEPTNNFYMTANNDVLNREALASLWNEAGDIDGYLRSDGGRFFWMGPHGTVTPYHHDLTNNLLVQVSGTKRVRIVASYDTPLMRNHLHCYSEWNTESLPAGKGDGQRPTVIECEIGPGQALFIPVGWWHHVEGLTPTIGLSFTNFVHENDFSRFYESFGSM